MTELPDRPGAACRFKAGRCWSSGYDYSKCGRQGLTNLSFTVPSEDAFQAEKALKEHFADGNGGKLVSTNIIKVSVVGVGMRSHSGVAATFFDALANAGIICL